MHVYMSIDIHIKCPCSLVPQNYIVSLLSWYPVVCYLIVWSTGSVLPTRFPAGVVLAFSVSFRFWCMYCQSMVHTLFIWHGFVHVQLHKFWAIFNSIPHYICRSCYWLVYRIGLLVTYRVEAGVPSESTVSQCDCWEWLSYMSYEIGSVSHHGR